MNTLTRDYAKHSVAVGNHSIELGAIGALTNRAMAVGQTNPAAFKKFLEGDQLGLPSAYAQRIHDAHPHVKKGVVGMRITEDKQAAKAALELTRDYAPNGLDLNPEFVASLMETSARETRADVPSRFLRSILCHFIEHAKRDLDFTVRYSPGIAGPAIMWGVFPELFEAMNKLGNSNRFSHIPNKQKVFANSDGTANLGLGWMPPASQIPIMAGKQDLMWLFGHAPADIHVFDPLTLPDPKSFLEAIRGYSNYGLFFMEDYTATIDDRCFNFEQIAIDHLGIPVTHDDQRAFAAAVLAFFINAMRTFGTTLADQKVILQGAGAASIAFARLLVAFGLPKERIYMLDTKGLIHKGRKGLDPNSAKFKWARDQDESDESIFTGATFYVGASQANAFEKYMPQFKYVADKIAMVFTANPKPEAEPHVMHEEATRLGKWLLSATGRTQDRVVTNNGLIFPGLVKAALMMAASSLPPAVFIGIAQALANIVYEQDGLDQMRETGLILPTYYHHDVFRETTMAAADAMALAGVGVYPGNSREQLMAAIKASEQDHVNPNKDDSYAAAMAKEPNLYLEGFEYQPA